MIDLADWQALSKLQRAKAYFVFLQRYQFGKLQVFISGFCQTRQNVINELDSAINGITRPLLSKSEVQAVCDQDIMKLVHPGLIGLFLIRPRADRESMREQLAQLARRHDADLAAKVQAYPVDAWRMRAGQ